METVARLKTDVCEQLECEYPILQAGMGGAARAELVSAVLGAGGYGFLGMVREPPELISAEIARVRDTTDRHFGVNLIPSSTDPMLLDEELAVCFEAGVHSMCFFWDVRDDVVERARAAGCKVLYQVGSVSDALAAEAAGADIIIAQGTEAGGHVRGVVSSLVLVPQVSKAVSIPVIASGGFASGQSLVAALALGAQGIHCGTAFLATRESFAHDYHRQRIIDADTQDTVYTDLYAINWPVHSPVRVIGNSVTAGLGPISLGHDPYARPRTVVGHDDGRPIYRFSTDSPLRTTTGEFEEMALFAGQVVGEIDESWGAGELVSRIVSEASMTLRDLGCGTDR